MSPQEMSSRAIQAAADLARALKFGQVEPEVLHISEHVSIQLHPLDLVARMLPADGADAQARLRRELDVAGHLVRREAPVAAPAAALSPGPYCCDGFVLT